MTDRATKRLRRLSTEYEDSEDNNEHGARFCAFLRAKGSAARHKAANWTPTATSTRPRRGTAGRNDASSATIQRSSPEETRQSLSLTVKSSPNKLRQATGVPAVGKGTLSRNNIVSGKRARNSRVVREIDSDEDEDEDEDEADEVSAMDVDDEEEEDDDVDAEGSEEDDMDAEGDEDDEDPIVIPTSKPVPVAAKPKISVTKAQDTVEAKEMAMSDDDEELSDPDSDLQDMEDAEGEDEDAEGEDDDELGGAGEDVDMDSDEDMSRDQTPDISKLTRRQRAVLEQEEDGSLLALSNEAQKKKHLTAEEHAMRRAEMARRRKNLSEKRNEEEKHDTINRLLKKQPPKRGRKSAAADLDESGQEGEAEPARANPLFVRYVQNAKGTQLAVPDEWLQAPVGSMFAGKPEPAMWKPAGRQRIHLGQALEANLSGKSWSAAQNDQVKASDGLRASSKILISLGFSAILIFFALEIDQVSQWILKQLGGDEDTPNEKAPALDKKTLPSDRTVAVLGDDRAAALVSGDTTSTSGTSMPGSGINVLASTDNEPHFSDSVAAPRETTRYFGSLARAVLWPKTRRTANPV
ncbi:hypothetical protein E8E11_004019 [Didymella keratinophila]|nr:hypothetical protein E8E11_004019 [Didymella keratinophila]